MKERPDSSNIPDAQARTAVLGIGLAGEVGVLPDPKARPELHIVLDGVWITTHVLPTREAGLVAVVSCDDLRKDLSQFVAMVTGVVVGC